MSKRWRFVVRGLVQGVGFRPYVYRIASDLGLAGYVRNAPGGVEIEAEGPCESLELMLSRLRSAPAPAQVLAVHRTEVVPTAEASFKVVMTNQHGDLRTAPTTLIPHDRAPCAECLRELMDPADRRYLFPFITCSTCGPRFTILRGLPFDRVHTTMAPFTPCNACSREYADPRDRRFHAETIACANCGPALELKNEAQETLFTGAAAIHEVVRQLRFGAIVAVKGIGGYQLLADASADSTLVRLRKGKARPGKPLAVLFDSLSTVAEICDVSGGEAQVLNSPEKPIVILRRKHVQQGRHEARTISPLVAPYSSQLGVMLPASPLHHVLMSMMGRPLVATSGNRHGEPISIDERTAFAKLHGVADVWLVHDRQILHRVDDAVVRISGSRPRIMRLGRGYAPLALEHRRTHVTDVLAVGGQEKNAFAVTTPQHIVLSQHIGDLASPEALSMLASESRDFAALLHCRPTAIVMDLHPDYQGARIATPDLRRVALQHHHAHALSCILEHGLIGPVLAFAWDGAGYGGDQTIWGGEILRVEDTRASRLGSLRSFSLPGGEQAMREPRRSALGLLYEVHGAAAFTASPVVRRAFTAEEQRLLVAAIHQRVNAPRTSSIGRLFDVAASILDLCQIVLYSEQAPVALENSAAASTTSRLYHMAIDHRPDRGYVLDWEPLVQAMLEDVANGVEIGAIARGFHEALADSIATIATAVGNPRQVVLTGGVFQNALLTSLAEERLDARGFKVYTHGLVPAGDGGLAAGQALYGLLSSCERKAVVCV